MRSAGDHLGPLEDTIRLKLIPSLTGDASPISDDERAILGLPPRWGGLGIDNPVTGSKFKYDESLLYTNQLSELISGSEARLIIDEKKQIAVARAIKAQREERYEKSFNEICDRVTPEQKRALLLASEKGASCPFTTIPYERYGFCFKAKRDWLDVVRLRYRKHVPGLPRECACGKAYSLDHSQICKKGGFIHMRHDGPKNLWTKWCSNVFRDVESEPPLEPLSGEVFEHKSAKTDADARSDTRVRGFWKRCRNAFFEFRVFYPFASTHKSKSPSKLYKQIADIRRREYSERIRNVEDGDFTPMILSSSGGMGPEMNIALKHLARLTAAKQNVQFSRVCGYLRAMFSFEMMRMALICLRGSRSPWSIGENCNVGRVEDLQIATSNLRL